MTERKLQASIRGVAITSSNVTLRIKTNLSTSHLQSAAYFSRKSAEFEKNKQITESLMSEHHAYVTGAIMLAVSSLESFVNELFLKAVDHNTEFFSCLPSNVPGLLSELWIQAERFPILPKYQIVLSVAEREKFDKGKSPYQEADDSIQIRNTLAHYKPEWSDELKEHKKIEDRLIGKFTLNPFSMPNQSFFPHRCLGHGCAEWAIVSCINFIEDFYQRLGLSSPWEEEERKLLLGTK